MVRYKYKYYIVNITVCRYACGIDLGTSYVVTGGFYSKQRVSQYSLTGEVTELPDLINTPAPSLSVTE